MAYRRSLGLRNLMGGINTEMVANGGFASAVTSWTANATASLSNEGSGQAGNCLRVTETGSAAVGQAYQAITTKIGHLYKFTGYFKKGTADSGKFLIGTTSAGGGTVLYDSGALTDAAWAQKTAYFVATATTTYIVCESTDATAGEYSDFDTITLVCQSRSYQDVFRYSQLKFYTGSQPATPQLAPTGTLVCTMNNGGAGMTFDDFVLGVLQKPAGETWNGVCEAAGGTVGWARLSHVGDSGADSDTEARADFRVSTSGAEMNFESVAWGGGSTQSISSLPITLPMSA